MLRWGKLEISGGFLMIAAALFYLDDQGIFPWAMAACALHEWGHYAAVRLMGGQILRLRLSAVGGEMQLSSRRVLSYSRELTAVLAGPAANLAVAFLVSTLTRSGGETAFLFAGLNLVIGIFNLLPAYPLDGGRVIKLLICILWSPEAAEHAVRVLTYITALVMLAAGGILLWKTGFNFTLLMVSLWILMGTIRI